MMQGHNMPPYLRPLFFLILFVAVGCGETTTTPGDVSADTTIEKDGAEADVTAADTTSGETGPTEDGAIGPDLSEAMFAPDRLLEIEIEIAAKDWDELCSQTRTFADILSGDCLAQPFAKIFTYFPGTVTVDGEKVENVGVRKKGFFGSLSADKPSLKIKFDAYVEGQLLQGMRRMTFNNSRQDASHMNTCLTYKAFRDAGYPAPRCNFARVTVNGKYLGVYIHVDSIKKPLLRRHFDDDDGNLYEGTLSDFTSIYKGTIEKKTNEKEDDWSDIAAAVAALETEGDEGLSAIDAIFNLDRFLTFWAIEVIVGHWDGYNGNLNNYFFYVDPADGRIVFLPWGPDSAFYPVDHPFDEFDYPPSVMANSALARRLYEQPAIREAYQNRMKEILETVWIEDDFEAEVDRMEALIGPHLPLAVKTKLPQEVSRLKWFIGQRKEAILEDIAKSPDWNIPPRESPCFKSRGSVKLSFETTWGSLAHAEPWTQGSVKLNEFILEGDTINLPPMGSVIGIEKEGPSAGQMVVSFPVFTPDANLHILYFVMEPNLAGEAAAGADIGKDVAGYWLRFKPPYQEFDMLGQLGLVSLTFDTFDNTSDAPVSGVLEATIF
jgi:spore coat protein CotH